MTVPIFVGTLRPRLFFVRLGTGIGSMTRGLGPRLSGGVSDVEDVVEDEGKENWVEFGGGIMMSLCMVDTSDTLRLEGGPDAFFPHGASEYESS